MGLGALRAEDFGHITQVACELAYSSCRGRVVSVLEGGYGVPCCRPQKDLFLPKDSNDNKSTNKNIEEGNNAASNNGQSSMERTEGQNISTTEPTNVTGTYREHVHYNGRCGSSQPQQW